MRNLGRCDFFLGLGGNAIWALWPFSHGGSRPDRNPFLVHSPRCGVAGRGFCGVVRGKIQGFRPRIFREKWDADFARVANVSADRDEEICALVVRDFDSAEGRALLKSPNQKGHNPVCPFCEQHTRGVRRAYFNSASITTCSAELFIANSDSSLLFGN